MGLGKACLGLGIGLGLALELGVGLGLRVGLEPLGVGKACFSLAFHETWLGQGLRLGRGLGLGSLAFREACAY